MVAKKKQTETDATAPKQDGEELNLQSFMRACEVSDARMRAFARAKPQELHNVPIRRKGQRPSKATDASSRARSTAAHLVHGEQARLPAPCDSLLIDYWVKPLEIRRPVLNNTSKLIGPVDLMLEQVKDGHHCESGQDTTKTLQALEKERDMPPETPLGRVAQYYAYNVCSGVWAWRNRTVCDAMDVRVYTEGLETELDITLQNVQQWASHAIRPLPTRGEGKWALLDDPDQPIKKLDEDKKKLVGKLAWALYRAWAGDGAYQHFRVYIEGRLTMARGAEVYPSQVYDPSGSMQPEHTSQKLGRILFRYSEAPGRTTAGMTEVKLGNALRTFDVGYNGAVRCGHAITADPAGGCLTYNAQMRGGANSFYRLRDKVLHEIKGESPSLDKLQKRFDEAIEKGEDQCFFVGVLIRGGSLGNAKKGG